MKNKVGRNYY